MDKRKRAQRITQQQYELYVHELESNADFRAQKFVADKPDLLEKIWEGLVAKLNSVGGPQKSVKQWRERFADWKFNVRKKARNLRLYKRGTGGGEPAAGTLTDLEQRLLGITGKVVVAGLVSLPKLGVPQCHGSENSVDFDDPGDPIETDTFPIPAYDTPPAAPPNVIPSTSKDKPVPKKI
ncbi:hypothetical protein Zmor_013578 [Zophobas morio]|uniref:Regulatory protein zeste n=1 Tax=Zophobas morio TaxID=2755281 RepID=A0AA38IAQ8_9CUCU|nr:hypothetical protein Zmor_013578 [Zophobas morio]